MTKDKIFFLITFALLGILAAYTFGGKSVTESVQIPVGAPSTNGAGEPLLVNNAGEILKHEEGKIAIPLQLTNRSGVVNFLKPGNVIDIIFTSKPDVAFGTLAVTLFKGIRVLGIGRDGDGKKFGDAANFYRPNTPTEILVELTLKQAEILSYAEAAGHITIGIVENDSSKKGNPKKNQKNDDELVQKLLEVDSETNFSSIIVTQMLNSIFPETDVKVTSTAKGFIVTGTVPDEQTAFNVAKTLDLLSVDGKKNVVNLIEDLSSNVEVLQAAKDLKENQALDEGDYTWVKVKRSESTSTYVVRSQGAERSLKKAKVLRDIEHGSKVLGSELSWNQVDTDSQGLASALYELAPGKRMIPVKVPMRAPIIAHLKPGVLVHMKFTSKQDVGFDPVNLVLLKGLRVMLVKNEKTGVAKTGAQGPADAREARQKDAGFAEVFLEMTPREAEIFSFAEGSGIVTLEYDEPEDSIEYQFLVEQLINSNSVGDFQSLLVTFMLRNLFPSVNISVTAAPRGYIVEGDVPSPQMAAKIMEILFKLVPGGERAIIDMMKIEPQQVLICVKVFEVGKDVISRIGINWQVLFQTATQSLAFGAIYPPVRPADANYFIDAAGTFGNYSLSALIDMLEEDGTAKILAEPNLTTISGSKANFFSGGEFPVLIPQGGQLIGTVTIEYKKYGMILDVSPEVDLNGLITLHIVPEVSNLDKANSVVLSGFVIPGLVTRRVDTIVKLWPGQTYLIAGLYLDEMSNINDNLYGLNKIPLIGSLFSSNAYRNRKTELLISVTPYLINNSEGYPCPPVETTPDCLNGDILNGGEPCEGPEFCAPCEEFVETPWIGY